MVFAKSERADAGPIEVADPSVWFGAPVWSVRLPDFERLNRKIAKAMERLMDNSPNQVRSNEGGWHSQGDLHADAEFGDLAAAILKASATCAEYVAFDSDHHEVVIDEMWLNRSLTGDYHTAHVHPNAMFSGVYYAEIPADGGFVEFIDPVPGRQMSAFPVKKKTMATAQKVEYRVKEGALLVFPAWLPHQVQPNRSNSPRVSVGFTIGHRPKR